MKQRRAAIDPSGEPYQEPERDCSGPQDEALERREEDLKKRNAEAEAHLAGI